MKASAEATSATVLSDRLPKSVSPSTKTQSMNQTTTPASMQRPIHVIGARLLINSESGNFDLREYCIGGGWWLAVGGWWLAPNYGYKPTANHQPPSQFVSTSNFG